MKPRGCPCVAYVELFCLSEFLHRSRNHEPVTLLAWDLRPVWADAIIVIEATHEELNSSMNSDLCAIITFYSLFL